MVSNGEVIHSGVIDGSNINAQVSPSDLQVALRYMFHLIVFKDPISLRCVYQKSKKEHIMVDFPQVLRMEIGSPNAGLLYSRLVPLVLLFVDGNHTPALALECLSSLVSINQASVHYIR